MHILRFFSVRVKNQPPTYAVIASPCQIAIKDATKNSFRLPNSALHHRRQRGPEQRQVFGAIRSHWSSTKTATTMKPLKIFLNAII